MVEFMNFGEILDYLKRGSKVARYVWNGKGMYIRLVEPVEIEHKGKESDYKLPMPECIAMYTAQKEFQLGWLASQTDMLAEDWYIVE